MSIVHGTCFSFIREQWQAIHDFDSDVLKIALYKEAATLDRSTTGYSATDEAAGSGYVAGGQAVTRIAGYPQLEGQRLVLRVEDIVWTSVDLGNDGAAGALLYNASKSNKAITVLSFGRTRTPRGRDFWLRFSLTEPPILSTGGY